MGEMINHRMLGIKRTKLQIEENEIRLNLLMTEFKNGNTAVMEDIKKCRQDMQTLRTNLNNFKLNKHMSMEVKWEPHTGMNRRQAKEFRKNHAKMEREYAKIKQ